jgi:Protein of unknown function (DUF3105)
LAPAQTPPAGNKHGTPGSTKQQREARKAEKVAKLKKQEATAKRNRLIAIIASSAAGAGVLALIVAFVVSSAVPKVDPSSIAIDGVKTWNDLTATHVDPTPVDYEATYGMTPPAGGDHFAAWLNCGVYDQPQQNENAVHALEHGAVWVTYDATALSDADIQTLRNALPSTYVILSPFEGLDAPVVASAWGAQLELDGVDDARLADFIAKYWQSPSAPEPGSPCTGAIDGPGKVA